MSTKSNVSAAPPRPSTIRWFRSVAATAACVAAVWGSAPSSSAAPQIGVAGLTGDPAGGGRNWALVHLRFMGGAEPHPSYRIYWKQGPADSPSAYILLGAMAPTADVPTLTELLNRAGLAGVDLVEFATKPPSECDRSTRS